MVIAKGVLDCQIGIIHLTFKYKFDISATVEILMGALNLQISEAFTIPKACQISIQHTKCLLTVEYFLLALHFILLEEGPGQEKGSPLYG